MESPPRTTDPSYSPGWKKPSDVMKLIRRRSSTSHVDVDKSVTALTNSSKGRHSDIGASASSRHLKRKNPFGCQSQSTKRLSNSFKQELNSQAGRLECSEENIESGNSEGDMSELRVSDTYILSSSNTDSTSSIFIKLDNAETAVKKNEDRCMTSLEKEILFGGSVSAARKTPSTAPTENRSSADICRVSATSVQPTHGSLSKGECMDSAKISDDAGDCISSFDWRLRTRLRFTSSRSFDWCHPLSSVDEAEGTRSFVSCSPAGHTASLRDVASSEVKREFHRHAMYWMHPNLPWLQLFPRHIIDSRMTAGNAAWTSSEEVLKTLQTSWTESMTSAYQNIRTGVCPFLYVCGQHLTVLFQAQCASGGKTVHQVFSGDGKSQVELNNSAGLNADNESIDTGAKDFSGSCAQRTPGAKVSVHAVLTPTSRGLREALLKEGIEFTMPLLSESRKTKLQQLKEQSSGGDQQTAALSAEVSSDVCRDTSVSSTDKPPTPSGESETSGSTDQAGGGATSSRSADHDDDDDNEDDDDDFNEAAGMWLEELGLDRKKYKSLDPVKIKDEKDIFKQIDYRSESTVVVESIYVNALFNYLVNSPTCLATTTAGQTTSSGTGLVGVPPTLLAPVAFRGATLQSLKVHQFGAVRQQISSTPARGDRSTGTQMNSMSPCYMMELSGPILPHTLHGLTRLLNLTQSGDLTVTSNVHEPSAALNALRVCLTSTQIGDTTI